MTTQPVLVLELFNAQVQYTVPRWQRRYRWGKPDIEDRLLNVGKPAKLRRQNGDEEEYRNELDHQERGLGAVSAAFKICRAITAREDLKVLMDGIERMQVVEINLQEHDDPQQIYESLNGTGQPLSEGEKVKNWLLMGLAENEQQELHDDVWKRTAKQAIPRLSVLSDTGRTRTWKSPEDPEGTNGGQPPKRTSYVRRTRSPASRWSTTAAEPHATSAGSKMVGKQHGRQLLHAGRSN